MTSNAATKDTIYIDVDDEITNIIEKVNDSPHKIIALVLPKRATMLQSIVNMKLLKRTADTTKKRVVLITSEAGLLPLAGAVGMYVAPNLQSKPVLPNGPDRDLPESLVSSEELEADEPDIDQSRSIGDLAGLSRSPKSPTSPEDETIELDNTQEEPSLTPGIAPLAAPKKNKKLKIPNFEKFRLLLILGGLGLVLLIFGLYYANVVMPAATITIKTDTANFNSNITFTASTTATALDEEAKIVPAKLQESKKTDSEKAPATGQKDIGTKASGSISVAQACSFDLPQPIPAGTGVSANNLTFITQGPLTFTPSVNDGKCQFSGSVKVSAQQNGDQYNLAPRKDYKISGRAELTGSDDTGMTGGTSNIVKIVSQSDVDNATQKLSARATQGAATEAKTALKQADMFPLTDTLITNDPVVTTTPNVGDQAAEVTVSSVTTSTMLGIVQKDIKKLVEDEAKKQFDTKKQQIRDNGLDDASYVVQDKRNPRQMSITVQALVKAGPILDTEGIKRQIAGKKKGETVSLIQSRPGIKDLTVEYSPFWVGKTPTKLNKITILFDQADAKK